MRRSDGDPSRVDEVAAEVGTGGADKVRAQVREIVGKSLAELGITISAERMEVLVSGYIGLACLATAEYRRAKTLHGPGPGAVDRMYQRDEARGHHDQQ